MKRRTFVSSVAAFICLPFPFLKKRCPYRIVNESWFDVEKLMGKTHYAFFEGDECVGYYCPDVNSFGAYVNPLVILDQFNETIAELTSYDVNLHIKYGEKLGHYFYWEDEDKNPKAWYFPNLQLSYIHVATPRGSTPEEVAWKIYAMRQVS